ncbi:MAG: phenylacetate--CoA ligase family protein [Pseudomonadota bacterium]
MEQERRYWNMEMEPILNTPQMREIQLEKIKKLVKRLYENKPFWRQRMDKAKVKPDDIKSLDDFRYRIPVFDKAQRRQLAKECEMDMVKVVDKSIGVPLENLCLMAATSGTTGEPTPYPHTKNDIGWLSENLARMLWRIGVRPGDRIIHAFGLSMWWAGVPYAIFFQKVGACVLPVGAEAGTERILRFAKLFKADTLACTPSLAGYLIEKAPEIIGDSVGGLGIKKLFCAGEPGAGIPEVRQKLETAYGAKLYDHGAAFGISCDWPEYQGMHHVADDKIYVELIDPETGEPLPFEDGARGVPVQTTLEGEGILWVRESLGDVFAIFTDPCPCGQTGFRYKVVGRIDDMLKIKGAMVYPAAIDGVITGFMPRVTGEFRVVLDEPPPRVVPPLKLKVEYGEGVKEEELENLTKEIEEKMHAKLKFRPQIQWLPPLTLERATQKTKFIEKAYEKK